MSVQVPSRRKFDSKKAKEVAPFMIELLCLAHKQPGFLSSESLECMDPVSGDEYRVRCSWRSKADWKLWLHGRERTAIQKKIDAVTGR